MQPGLKESPQFFILFISAWMIVLGALNRTIAFKAVNILLMIVLMSTFCYQVIDQIIFWLNPDRGFIEVDGELHRVMDMSGIFSGFLSVIIALIYAFATTKWNAKKSIQSEFHLAIATFVSTAIGYIFFELF